MSGEAPGRPVAGTRDARFPPGPCLSPTALTSKTRSLLEHAVHMERSGAGGLSLLMTDAPATRASSPQTRRSGVGNFRELMRVVDQAKAELEPHAGPWTLRSCTDVCPMAVFRSPFLLTAASMTAATRMRGTALASSCTRAVESPASSVRAMVG